MADSIIKTYHLGQFYHTPIKETNFYVGIHRQSAGGLEVKADDPIINDVRSRLTGRILGNLDELKGYFLAVNSEFGLEGEGPKAEPLFKLNYQNWSGESAKLFKSYLDTWDYGEIKPLTPSHIQQLTRRDCRLKIE